MAADPSFATDAGSTLNDFLWLGGSPCAGKSTVAGVLARRFGLDLDRVDEAFEHHAHRFDGARQPTLGRWCAASANERWLQPIDALLRDAIGCYREHWGLILQDVEARPKSRPLLVERTALLPVEVDARGLRRLAVDGGRTEDEVAKVVAAQFGLGDGRGARGP